MTHINANTNAETVTVAAGKATDPSVDGIPVTEVSQRLGVTLPRLQRALKRPEFAGAVSTGVRITRTGTRTVTLVNVRILDSLSRWLDEGKQKHLPPKVFALPEEEDGGLTSPQLGAYYDRLMAEKDARLADAQERIKDLQAALQHERKQSHELSDALAREQSLRLLSVERAEPKGSRQEDAASAALAAEKRGDDEIHRAFARHKATWNPVRTPYDEGSFPPEPPETVRVAEALPDPPAPIRWGGAADPDVSEAVGSPVAKTAGKKSSFWARLWKLE